MELESELADGLTIGEEEDSELGPELESELADGLTIGEEENSELGSLLSLSGLMKYSRIALVSSLLGSSWSSRYSYE